MINSWHTNSERWEIALVDRGTLQGIFLLGTDISDTLTGGDEGDLIYGGRGSDLLIGNDGADNLLGESGNDQLEGGNGNDVLIGGIDDDQLEGGNGNDVLIGGIGDDILSGGHGSDTFIIDVRLGTDSIAYDVSEKLDGDVDRISLSSPDIHDALILVHDPETNELKLVNTTTPKQVVVVEGWNMSLEDSLLPIQEIAFSSGEVWDIQEIQSRIIDGSQDFNNDGLSALNDIASGFDPTNTDHDGDGLSNRQERFLGTNIFSRDSDGDGVSDALDADPRDSLVTTSSGFTAAGDLEIVIDFPTNAILVD